MKRTDLIIRRSAGLDQLGPAHFTADWSWRVPTGNRGPERISRRAAKSTKARRVKVTLPKVTLPPIDESAS